MPTDTTRTAFGERLKPPSTQRECVDEARRLAGRWQASAHRGEVWFGEALAVALHTGESLERVLGLTSRKGSHVRAAEIIRQEETAGMLRRLASQVGVAKASRMLQGVEVAPAAVAELVQALRERHAPASKRSIVRARNAPR